MSVERLAQLWKDTSHVLIFTGAGISTGSGIPDFRGPQGLWKRWRPVYYQDFMSSHQARVKHWQYKAEGWEGFREARPNTAHRTLAELDRMGRVQAIVTQNIDGLHQLAGHPEGRVIELHGTNREVECQSCLKRMDPDPVFEEFAETGEPPLCECGGFLKPATVSFGQQMPAELLARAFALAALSDLAVAIGSTLEVEPAASVPRAAQERGAAYAIVNQGPTAHDAIADVRLEGDAVSLLPAVLEAMRQ